MGKGNIVEEARAVGTLALASRGFGSTTRTEEAREREMFLHLFHPHLEGHPELWEGGGE